MALAASAALATACATAGPAARLNPAVIVLPGAADVRRADIYDGQVSYTVSAPYPAEAAITEIQRRLRQLGWRPRDRDLLNPEGSSATSARWTETEIDGQPAFAWSQQWENSAGDVVWYGLRYRSKTREGVPAAMNVTVSYFASERAKALEAEKTKR